MRSVHADCRALESDAVRSADCGLVAGQSDIDYRSRSAEKFDGCWVPTNIFDSPTYSYPRQTMPLGSLIHVMMPLLIGLGEAFRLYPNDCQSAFKVTDVQAIIHSGHMRDEMKQGRLSASVWPIANVSMLKVLVDFMNDNGQVRLRFRPYAGCQC